MITDKEFIKEDNEEEILSVIESFLNRWRTVYAEKGGNSKEKELYNYLPIDKEKVEIVREMIEDFKRY